MKGDDDLIDRITLCVGKTLAVLGFVGGGAAVARALILKWLATMGL